MSKIFKNVQNFQKCQIFKNVQIVQNFIFLMIFGHNCSCPITRDCAFVYTNLFSWLLLFIIQSYFFSFYSDSLYLILSFSLSNTNFSFSFSIFISNSSFRGFYLTDVPPVFFFKSPSSRNIYLFLPSLSIFFFFFFSFSPTSFQFSMSFFLCIFRIATGIFWKFRDSILWGRLMQWGSLENT